MTLVDAEGDETEVEDAERLKLSDYFTDLRLRQGVGGNFQVFRQREAELDLRLGFGTRQTIPRGVRVFEVDEKRVVVLSPTHTEGIESGAVGLVRLTRWVTISSDFDGLAPFGREDQVIITWRTQVSLHLASFASLAYGFDFIRDPELGAGAETQTAHDVKLLFSYTLF